MRPLLVTCDSQTAETRIAELERQGWDCRRGWELPEAPYWLQDERMVLQGDITSFEDIGAVVAVACRGVGIVALAESRDLELRCAADLRRVAPEQMDPIRSLGTEPVLTGDQRAVLELVARGQSVASAARELHVSVRTAERRLREARLRLGASTTAEAVARIAYDLEP